jgi:uncharacterized protein
MQNLPGSAETILSASDLMSFLACTHLTHEGLRSALGLRGRLPRDESPHAELAARHGDRHEAEALARLSALAGGHVAVDLPPSGYGVEALERAALETVGHMRAGAGLIHQGVVFDGRWQGRVDFLRRIERPSALGAHAYEVVDAKLARAVRPKVVHQLSLYARLVADVQGAVVDHAWALLGDGTEERVDLRRYAALHRRVVARLEALVTAEPLEVYPEPVAHCGLCRLELECTKRRRADDHLSFVAGARRTHRDALTAAGTLTLEALALLGEDAVVAGVAPDRLLALRGQAALQRDSRDTGLPTHAHLDAERERGYARLPRPSAGDVFFDFEGDPYVGDGGIEYLWGWVTADGEEHHVWAHDKAGEAAALRAFVAWVQERRRAYPDLHVFHYGAHEASKLASLAQEHGACEAQVDDWLRNRLLVDLYAVVRQAMQVGEESYSLKRLERHVGFAREEHTVRDGGGSIVAYETWLETGDPALLEAIRRYNAEDCASTAALYRWLVHEMRPAAAAQLGADFDELARPEPTEPAPEPKYLAELQPVLDALDDESPEQRLLANLLLYHPRENKPQFWHWFALHEMTPEALVDDPEAIGMITRDGSVPAVPVKKSLQWRYRFPPQDVKLNPKHVKDPITGGQPKIVELGEDFLVAQRRATDPAPDIRALIPTGPPRDDELRAAQVAVAQAVIDGAPDFAAVRALLSNEPPTVDLSACDTLDGLKAATLALGDSYLAVQGPPGSGKTFSGAHMVVAALRAGRRVAVTANSHAAIQNLLHAIEDRAVEDGVRGWRGVYKGNGYDSPAGLVTQVDDNKAACTDEDDRPYDLVAGTAWLLSRPEHRGRFALLVVDEAGQFSLANAVAAGTAADGLVLLGDTQQLPQVNQASHPHGAGASVLAHVLDGADVMPCDRGVFLGVSRRMHPEVCRFASERSYHGRLVSTESCGLRRVDAPGTLSGAGLRAVGVEHEGCSQESAAEAQRIGELCRELLSGGATVTDDAGATRALTADDILVVAPYNLARRRIAMHVPAGVRVGTVDKFQG